MIVFSFVKKAITNQFCNHLYLYFKYKWYYFFVYNQTIFDKNTCYYIQLEEVVNIKLIKSVLKIINKDYNYINEDNFIIAESGNPYGHVKEFNRLDNSTKRDAHRVISNKALSLFINNISFGAATDINGNIYYFDVFEDGYYRVVKVNRYNNDIKEVTNERTLE